MILSDVDIRKCIENGTTLIKPFCEERLRGASYDLSMSNKIAVFKKQVRTIQLDSQTEIDSIYDQKELTSSGYILDPGEYVLVTIAEELNIPVNMTAHIRPRTKFSRLGLIVSAQHCNPGYTGILQLGIHNVSPNAITLIPGLSIAQVVFEELKSVPSVEKQYQNQKNAAYMGEYEFRGAVFTEHDLPPEAKAIYEALRREMSEA